MFLFYIKSWNTQKAGGMRVESWVTKYYSYDIKIIYITTTAWEIWILWLRKTVTILFDIKASITNDFVDTNTFIFCYIFYILLSLFCNSLAPKRHRSAGCVARVLYLWYYSLDTYYEHDCVTFSVCIYIVRVV